MIIFAKYGDYDRRQFIETCLEKYLETTQLTKLSEVNIEKGKNDKPYFKDYPDIRFSISHSGNLVVLAMSDTEVGIDVEEIKPRPWETTTARVLTEGEKKEVTDLESFLRVWTKKEAYLKFTGDGLGGIPVADVSKPVDFEGKPLNFVSLDIFEGFVGAVVSVAQPVIFVQLD